MTRTNHFEHFKKGQFIWVVFFVIIVACTDTRLSEELKEEAKLIQICHVEEEELFRLTEQNQQDFPLHLLHGDGIPGGPVPHMDGFVFSQTCLVIQDSNAGSCLKGMAHIDNFCIDRWEAHLKGKSPYEVHATGEAETAEGIVPQGYISGDVAEMTCQASGKRLCTSDEWLRACQGPDLLTYPYGNSYLPSNCNEGRELHPIVELFGEAADWSSRQMNDPRINQLPDALDITGGNPACMSLEGVYDLHGNLHEWVADAEGTFRGGFYVDAEINGAGCLYRTTAHGRSYHDYSTGFRCCSNAQ